MLCVFVIFPLLSISTLHCGTFITYMTLFYPKDLPSIQVEAINKHEHSSPKRYAKNGDLRCWQM